eukprot:CAMPEP_0202354392 /NCGR_PEP_ID=MMETSP1126-20121109/9731_1 /ASSEMBLY_ACC=CAM_ASM_000457 /TAXON_ID=3047 /ORGANISM="Dunaliella tertiolecta, Strain CCMP1320" /LENGTH=642 /DNA_ID=CAMNT_0048946851 /DNA_START=219 /DNA_END=2148 /DNA_ORIENTATION=+
MLKENYKVISAAAVDQQASDEPPEGWTEMTYVDYLNFEFGIPDVIQFSEGVNGLPRAWIRHPHSAAGFEVYLHGAAITQWLRPDGTPALNFNPRTTAFDPSRIIKGGMRLAFPAYRENTQMSEDGFAGRLPWEVVAAGFDFMGLDDGMHSKKYEEALERFDQMEQEAIQRGYWLPENQGEETKRKADLAARWFKKSHEAEMELAAKFDEQRGKALRELEEVEQQLQEAEQQVGEDAQAPAASLEQQEELQEGGEEDIAGLRQSAEEGEGAAEARLGEARPSGEAGEGVQAEGAPGIKAEGKKQEPPEASQEQGGKEGAQGGGGEEEEEEELDEDAALTIQALHEIEDKMEQGLDPAPFITLRLADTPETRLMWPHKFELLYKITVSEEDDYKDPMPEGERSYKDDFEMAQEEPDDEVYRPPPAGGRLDEKGKDIPVQIKMQLLLRNFDEPGSQPMNFQVANLATFAIKDILLNPNMVKILGLAGTTALNYTQDDRAPTIQACKEDFIYINGQRLDATFVKAADANLKLSPADGTHYEIQARKGLLDTVAFHPGSTSHNDYANELLTLGVGNVTTPSRLGPGETWESELVVRWFNQYWDRPPFENDMLPMPALRRQDFSTDTPESSPFANVQDDSAGGEEEDA